MLETEKTEMDEFEKRRKEKFMKVKFSNFGITLLVV
jgi:hypothetical protein